MLSDREKEIIVEQVPEPAQGRAVGHEHDRETEHEQGRPGDDPSPGCGRGRRAGGCY